MKTLFRIPLLMLLLLAFGSVFAKSDGMIVPGKWIVELSSPPGIAYTGGQVARLERHAGGSGDKTLAATAPHASGRERYEVNSTAVQAYVEHLSAQRETVLQQARGMLGRPVVAESVYRHVFNGFAANMSEEEAGRLAALRGVRSVRPVRAHKLQLDEGPELIGAREVHSGLTGVPANGGEGTVIGIIDSGINWENMYFSDDTLPSGHAFSNPYDAPLGDCDESEVDCNDKLVGVYDFTEEGTTGKDPEGHGTHVASTAAGIPLDYSIGTTGDYVFRTTGVAPHSSVISYKVCYLEHPTDDELDNSCETSAIMDALEQAVEDEVDVINYSIGSPTFDPWQGATHLLNLWSAGIPFVASAGNEGPDEGSISSPANAPWVFAVGSSSHGRLVGSSVSVAGVPDVFVTYGSGPELQSNLTAPVVAAESLGIDALGCSPFPAGSMSESVAFIQRGVCSFSDKIDHAASAGAIAVLVYNNVEGAPIVMGGLEGSSIPAAMMDLDSGEAVREAIIQESEPTANLSTEGFAADSGAWRDYVSAFSARGPASGSPGIMKPNVVAPGANILAGWFDGENSIAFSSGTSMASPHAAGSMALLKSLNPDWTPDILHSVLETTAESDSLRWNDSLASVIDRGAGRIRVDRAARAGLYLPVSRNDFEAADPSSGGDPGSLNLAGLWDGECEPSCSFTRTVRALGSGSWNVSVESDLDVSVSPDSFSLGEGEEQEIEVSVATAGLFAGMVGEGEIFLTPTSGSFVEQKLTLGVQVTAVEQPDTLDLTVEANRGSHAFETQAGPLPEPIFRSSGLERPIRESFALVEDPSPDSPYQGSVGRAVFLHDVSADSLLLYAEIASSQADDIDLYVGRDDNGNGIANSSEEVCSSTSPNEFERCIIELPEPGTWWVLVQNWQASAPGAEDAVELDVAVLSASSDTSLVATGPGRHEGGDLTVNIAWDQPAMRRGQTRIGAVGFSSSPDNPDDLGVLPVLITRDVANPTRPTALFEDEARPVVVPAGSRHDRLFIDVPPAATRLLVSVEGDDGVDVELHRLGFEEISGHAPGTPPAPNDDPLVSGSVTDDGLLLAYPEVAGSNVAPGRYYIVLESTGSEERVVEVSASIQEEDPILPRFGLWSPLERNLYQGFEWSAGAAGVIVWYSYDENGLPVFYNAVAEIEEDRSTWAADLLRTTSLGSRSNVDAVGRIAITGLGSDDMIVAWRLDGAHGSERLTPASATSCPQIGGEPVSYTGHWYSPAADQGGTTMIVTAEAQAQVRYYFDTLGVGRWVITTDAAGGGPLTEQLDVLELRGFCPTCEQGEVTIQTVGSYVRMFDSEDSGTEILEFESRPPLNQSYSTEVPISKLTSRLTCM